MAGWLGVEGGECSGGVMRLRTRSLDACASTIWPPKLARLRANGVARGRARVGLTPVAGHLAAPGAAHLEVTALSSRLRAQSIASHRDIHLRQQWRQTLGERSCIKSARGEARGVA